MAVRKERPFADGVANGSSRPERSFADQLEELATSAAVICFVWRNHEAGRGPGAPFLS